MRPLANRLERIWSTGAAGQPPQTARQITLSNQAALFAFASTVPYQIYYLATDPAYYLPLLLSNLAFMAVHASVLPLNRVGRVRASSVATFGTVHLQLLVVTHFLGTGAGVHLFYFTMGACAGLFFGSDRTRISVPLIGLSILLYLVCHFAYPPETARLVVPAPALDVMYAGSTVGALFLSGVIAHLFRRDMDRAEAALTSTNEDLERLSGLDPLTGLANRRALDDCLRRECARLRRPGQRISVLLCDVDCFKAYNDFYGHLAGDACLQRVAGVLSSIVRRANDVIARYGGEEFVIVLPTTDSEGALRIAEEARALVRTLAIPHERSHVAPVVTLSIGVASADAEKLEGGPEELLRRADAALYTAKREGRDQVVEYE